MSSANALLLLSIALTGCAGTSARPPRAETNAPALARPTQRATARLGPPSPRGLGLRRVDRPSSPQAPLALY